MINYCAHNTTKSYNAGIWDEIKHLYCSHTEVHIILELWCHLVNDIDLSQLEIAKKSIKLPILAFKVIQGH